MTFNKKILFVGIVIVAILMLIVIFKPQNPKNSSLVTIPAPQQSQTQGNSNININLTPADQRGPVTAQAQATFKALNNSNITGETTFKEVNGLVYIAVNLTGASDNVQYPAYVYKGTCQDTNQPKYSLSPVVNGKTENYINKTMAEIKKEFPLSVKVLKDQNPSDGFVSCAQLQ